jgi:hypothetical protein
MTPAPPRPGALGHGPVPPAPAEKPHVNSLRLVACFMRSWVP